MIESRCGIICSQCPYHAQNGGLDGSTCAGCTHMDKPLWADSCPVKSCCENKTLEYCGLCADFPCNLLVQFANDKEHGDGGRRLEQCKKWLAATKNACCSKSESSCVSDAMHKKVTTPPLEYEIVELAAKTVAGFSVRTSNASSDMQKDIGTLWQHFFSSGGYDTIEGKANGKSIGLYTNYKDDFRGAYDVVACCEVVDGTHQPDGIEVRHIPALRYAKFVVNGPMQEAVGKFWQKLWNMDLPRAYTGDFEEYQDNCTMEHSVIHMYISLS